MTALLRRPVLRHALLFAAVAALAAWALVHQFRGIGWDAWLAALRAQPVSHVCASLALTALSFAALASYDWLGVRIVAPGQVPAGTALLAGATANAISNTLGFHAITGSAVRARIYARAGLGVAQAARVVSLSWLALGLGFVAMLALAWSVEPGAARWLGAALALALAGLLAWLAKRPRELRVFGFRQPLPSARIAAWQMAIGAVESAAAIGALYVLLPPDLAPPFAHFAVGCIAAIAAGIVAHAPGGIGVFEAAITALVAGTGRADLLAALVLYRAIYNLLPFLLSLIALWLFAPKGRVSSNADSA